MKLAATLAAVALIGCASAFAADAPAAGAAAPAATPAKHVSLKACNKQADEKKLTGADRSKFVKDCHAGKSAS
jgi:hypothetical protein